MQVPSAHTVTHTRTHINTESLTSLISENGKFTELSIQPADILAGPQKYSREKSRIKKLLAAANGGINKMRDTSFTFFNYQPFDVHAEHSVINISADNGVTSH